jgi:hypothetical protein
MVFYRQPGQVSSALTPEESHGPRSLVAGKVSVEHHQVITLGQVGRGFHDEALRTFRAEVRGLLAGEYPALHLTPHPTQRARYQYGRSLHQSPTLSSVAVAASE